MNWQEIIEKAQISLQVVPPEVFLYFGYGATLGIITGFPLSSVWKIARSGSLVNPPSEAKAKRIELEGKVIFGVVTGGSAFVFGTLRLAGVLPIN